MTVLFLASGIGHSVHGFHVHIPLYLLRRLAEVLREYHLRANQQVANSSTALARAVLRGQLAQAGQRCAPGPVGEILFHLYETALEAPGQAAYQALCKQYQSKLARSAEIPLTLAQRRQLDWLRGAGRHTLAEANTRGDGQPDLNLSIPYGPEEAGSARVQQLLAAGKLDEAWQAAQKRGALTNCG